MSVTEFTPAKFAVVLEASGRRVDRPGKITRAEELRLQLADEIVQGALRPGAPLDETEIAKRFNVSRTPVREALRQLAASGLIEARANRRAVVARPSLERLSGMFQAMAELEGLCAGSAAERMPLAERHRLQAVHEELRLLSYVGNPDRFHEVNERFHHAIYTGSQNSYIAEITLATRVRVQPFRRAQFRNLGRLAKSHAEHEAVVVAIMRGTGTAPPRRCARTSNWFRTNTKATCIPCSRSVAHRLVSAMNARQPLNAVMSRAPARSAGSTRNPFTPRPSRRRIVPMDSGGGTAATNVPNAFADIAHSSSSIDDPAPACTRSMPGFCGGVSSAYSL